MNISRRDYFAAHAPPIATIATASVDDNSDDYAQAVMIAARMRFAYADMMLAVADDSDTPDIANEVRVLHHLAIDAQQGDAGALAELRQRLAALHNRLTSNNARGDQP